MNLSESHCAVARLALSLLVAFGCSKKDEVSAPVTDGGTWAAGIIVNQTGGVTIAGTAYKSSTRLAVSWTAPTGQTVDHYEVTATESMQSTKVTGTSTGVAATLTGLRSSTTYAVAVDACLNVACTSKLTASATAAGTTPEEYWQIQGDGGSYAAATKVVTSEGQTLSYALKYGNDAPGAVAGRVRYFYNPGGPTAWGPGLRVAVNGSTDMDAGSLSSFSKIDAGMRNACDPNVDAAGCPAGDVAMMAFQPIPLTNPQRIRVFYEGNDPHSVGFVTRLYSFDLQDGYLAEDFHPDAGVQICGGPGSSDFTPTGKCAPTLVMGVASDDAGSPFTHVRQSKIGYPKQSDWRWDMDAGAFIIMTAADSCGVTQDGIFYATWTGATWAVKKETNGCAKPMALYGHGPVIVHLGGMRYKLYYEESSLSQPGQDKAKPLKLLYADGTVTGASGAVEFEDWEVADAGRHVHFLWPNGTLLDAGQESGLGDHFILMPNSNADTQYMYMNLGGGDDDTPSEASTGLGMAVLVNP